MKSFIQNKKLVFFLIILIGLFALISIVFAQTERRLLTDWPTSPAGTELTVESDITDLIRYFYEWGIALGGLIVFIIMLSAGFNYLTSAGDPGKMKEAINSIQSAFLGLILLLSSWLILNTINPELTRMRPLLFDPRQAFQTCNTSQDCNQGEICTKIQGADFGVCIPKILEEELPPPCNYVMFVTKEGNKISVIAGEHANIDDPRSMLILRTVQGSEAGTHDKEGNKVAGGAFIEGGACVVELFEARGGWFGGCRELITSIIFPITNVNDLSRHTFGRIVRCVRIRGVINEEIYHRPEAPPLPPTGDPGVIH